MIVKPIESRIYCDLKLRPTLLREVSKYSRWQEQNLNSEGCKPMLVNQPRQMDILCSYTDILNWRCWSSLSTSRLTCISFPFLINRFSDPQHLTGYKSLHWTNRTMPHPDSIYQYIWACIGIVLYLRPETLYPDGLTFTILSLGLEISFAWIGIRNEIYSPNDYPIPNRQTFPVAVSGVW